MKLGLVGLGQFMYGILYPAMKSMPVQLAAACDNDVDRLQRFAGFYHVPRTYTDYETMIAEEALDVVVCVIDAEHHYQVAKACLREGIHVFVEKCPCLSGDQAQELTELMDSSGRYMAAGFNRRFTTAYMMAHAIVHTSEFGPTLLYNAKYHAGPYASESYFVFNHLVHHLDLARYFLGELELRHLEKEKIDDQRVAFSLQLRSQEGAIASIQSGSVQCEFYPMERVEITGLGTNVIIDNVKHLQYNRPAPPRDTIRDAGLSDGGDALVWNLNQGYHSGYSYYGFEHELEVFFGHLCAGTRPAYTIRDAVPTMRLLDAVREKIEDMGT
jgi:predicted dehydrogenase